MELAEKILVLLSEVNSTDSLKISSKFDEDHQKIVGAIKSLESLGNVVKTESQAVKKFELTKEGEEVARRGSHEAVVFGKVPKEVLIVDFFDLALLMEFVTLTFNFQGIDQATLSEQLSELLGGASKVGFSKAMSLGWITMDKSASGGPKVVRKVDKIEDEVQKHLSEFTLGKVDHVSGSLLLHHFPYFQIIYCSFC